MIKVKVYLNQKEIGSLTIHNNRTGTPERGNYKFDITSRERDITGHIEDFPRTEKDVWSLILEVLKKVKGE